MDSLTHIVVGAALGDVIAGKKIGNRAMLWGAVGNSIPDLDVFSAFFTDEITATAWHRGISHSILFAVVLPFGLAYLTDAFYRRGIHQRRGYKLGAGLAWGILVVSTLLGLNFLPLTMGKGLQWEIVVPTLLIAVWFGRNLYLNYWKAQQSDVAIPYRTWVLLFFVTILGHPILDCFNNWGTQLFQPFSDLRVQWNMISVIDPIPTLPVLLAVVVASRLARSNPRRQWWTWGALAWLTLYFVPYAGWHKYQVGRAVERDLAAKGVEYQRYMTMPVIFNNLVWSFNAEADSVYFMGQLGFNDCQLRAWQINEVPKNHSLVADIDPNDRDLKFLKWFSNGYWNAMPRADGQLQLTDLRFGVMGDTFHRAEDLVFPFIVDEKRDGHLKIHHDRNTDEMGKRMADLWRRIKGICPEKTSPK